MRKSLVGFALAFMLVPSLALADFSQDLKFGMVNNDSVRELQQFLRDQKVYSGPVTGNYYALTKLGVSRFQRLQGIKPYNGVFNEATRVKASALTQPAPAEMHFMDSLPPVVQPVATTTDVSSTTTATTTAPQVSTPAQAEVSSPMVGAVDTGPTPQQQRDALSAIYTPQLNNIQNQIAYYNGEYDRIKAGILVQHVPMDFINAQVRNIRNTDRYKEAQAKIAELNIMYNSLLSEYNTKLNGIR